MKSFSIKRIIAITDGLVLYAQKNKQTEVLFFYSNFMPTILGIYIENNRFRIWKKSFALTNRIIWIGRLITIKRFVSIVYELTRN